MSRTRAAARASAAAWLAAARLAAGLGLAGDPDAVRAQPTRTEGPSPDPGGSDAGAPPVAAPPAPDPGATPPRVQDGDAGVDTFDGGAGPDPTAPADAGPAPDGGPDGGFLPADGGVVGDAGVPDDGGGIGEDAGDGGRARPAAGGRRRPEPDRMTPPERRRRPPPEREPPAAAAPDDGGGTGASGPPGWLAPLLPQASPAGSLDVGALLAVLLLFGLARLTARLRRGVHQGGLVDRSLALVLLGSRLGLTAAALLLLAALVPGWIGPVALAALVAVGWSVRDVAPDLLAGLVLLAERRVLTGTEIGAGDVRGVVASRGLRATVLRDERGRRVTVPNRLLLRAPLSVRGDGGRVHEAAFLLDRAGLGPDQPDAATIRWALFDTVVTSPWVPAHARPEIRQDGERSRRWWVRTELLDSAFVARFDGELLERLRERLPRPPEPPPPGNGDDGNDGADGSDSGGGETTAADDGGATTPGA